MNPQYGYNPGQGQMQTQDYNFPSYNVSSQSNDFDESVLKEFIDVEKTLQKFEMEVLRGMRLVIDTKNKKRYYEPIDKVSKPLCNSLGIREILGRLRGRITTFGRLTAKDEPRIMNDMFHFHMSLVDMFTKRADDWDMEEENIKPIMDACVEMVEDLVFSSIDGFTAINMKSQYSKSEVQQTSTQGKQDGRLQAFLSRK